MIVRSSTRCVAMPRSSMHAAACWASVAPQAFCRLVAFAMVACLLGCDQNPSAGLPRSDAERKEAEPEATHGSLAKSLSSAIALEWREDALAPCLYRNGSEHQLFALPETTGGGLAVLDFDRDGRMDVFSAGGGYPDLENRVLKGYPGALCRGLEGMRFASVSLRARVDLSSIYNAAIAVADYDADGFDDVLVTGYSGLQFLKNQGDGTFASLPCPEMGLVDQLWSSSAAFFDADQDGLLDLYVVHYADWSFDNNPNCSSLKGDGSQELQQYHCGPREFKGLPDSLFKNLGDGTFLDVTEGSGLEHSLRGLSVVAADLDGDLDVDLYVCNDVDPNLLYRNDGDFHFTEIGRRSGVACNDIGTPEGSMGIAVGDYNSDGKFDLWVTNYQNEIGALYRNNGNLLFTYASHAARIAATDEASVGWGTAFCDIDADGDEDLVVVNGHIEMRANGSSYDQRPQVLENMDGKWFRLVPSQVSKYLSTPQPSRSLAMADFDRDGKMDFVASRVNLDPALVLNQTPTTGSYLAVRLVGTQSNRNAIGAVARLNIAERTWVRQLVGGGSYAGTSDYLIHFGIPASHAALAGTLTIRWPSGKEQTLAVDRLNQEWLLVEGE